MLSAIRGIDPAAANQVAAELYSLLACSAAEVDENVSLIDALVASTTAAATMTPEKSENNNPAAPDPPIKKPYQNMDCVHGDLWETKEPSCTDNNSIIIAVILL